MIARHLAIVGLGLIGGSLARALRSAGAVERISGYDIDPEQLRAAQALSVVDLASGDMDAVLAGADMVVLAVPVLCTGAVFSEVYPRLPAGAVITDVGSTKVSVLQAVAQALGKVPPNFVPGHPIAGTEKSGVASSFESLFRGRRVILTPHPDMAEVAGARVQRMWEAAGAQVECMSPLHHDEILAATSHLPHLLAYALVDQLGSMASRQELFRYAAGGFRDFTRIASSSPTMWHDIVRANRPALLPLVDRYIERLRELRTAIADDDGAQLLRRFSRARDVRERFMGLSEAAALAATDGKTESSKHE